MDHEIPELTRYEEHHHQKERRCACYSSSSIEKKESSFAVNNNYATIPPTFKSCVQSQYITRRCFSLLPWSQFRKSGRRRSLRQLLFFIPSSILFLILLRNQTAVYGYSLSTSYPRGDTDRFSVYRSHTASSVPWIESNQRRCDPKLFHNGRHLSKTTLLWFRYPHEATRLNMIPSDEVSPSSAAEQQQIDNDNDDDEWKAVVAAFQMYKAAYGDLKVPQRFVVPDIAPWPKISWGLKLGKVVSAIRLTGRYLLQTSDPATRNERRKLLDSLGFVWSVRRSASDADPDAQGIRLEQIVTATELYKRIVGDIAMIPENFSVPDSEAWPESVRGLPLGRQLEMIKRSKNEALRTKFRSLGVPMEPLAKTSDESLFNEENSAPSPSMLSTPSDIAAALEKAWDGYPDGPSANDIRFQNVYTALVTYKRLYDDLLVPQPFVVPKDPQWPEDIWGLRLGARVNAIRSQGTFVNNNSARRKLLDDLGFVWNPPKERRRGRKTKDEKDMSSDESLDDMDSEDASETDGNRLSDMSMLFDGSFDFGRDFDAPSDDEKATLTWNLDGARMPETSLSAMSGQDAKEEEYKAPRTLEESMVEATARALEVGIIEGLTEKSRVIKGKREKNIPWFNDDFGGDFVFEDVVEALTIFKSLYGDFSSLKDSDFIVPASKEITGFLDMDNLETFDIDASSRAAAAIANYKEQGQLDRSADLVAAEINRLQLEEDQSFGDKGRNSAMEAEFYADKWPEHLAGMALGRIVGRIRDGSLEVKHLPERKAQLDAMEFDWGDPKYFIDVPFEKAMCAMYAYYLVRGDLFVAEDFVMPDEDPWPQALAGYEIGKAVKRLRELQNFLEAYHNDKIGLLRMIDFVWFADTMALPLDSNEKEMDAETLLLSAMGHPDYAKMIDIPMGLPDKIVADGPFFETEDDPKLWWRKWHNWEYVKDYWYQQGRRDNAYVLRAMGYPRMADEHEAKYGPGLFSEIDKVMADLENGSLNHMNPDEKKEMLEKLNFFRQEMLGCTDILPQDRDRLLSEFDSHMRFIMNGRSMDISLVNEPDSTVIKKEAANGTERKAFGLSRLQESDESTDEEEMFEVDEETEDDGLIEEEFDVENELGLGEEPW
jgi:Helicase associated domain